MLLCEVEKLLTIVSTHVHIVLDRLSGRLVGCHVYIRVRR